ncbi:FmdB family zinc ribbon protein [Anaeroselena agilis]|uniref:FmdB family zinc ribbon protein n=1 Tax=Anaeroselena agilis TaxID=3063788 RepID=UPI0039B6EB6B
MPIYEFQCTECGRVFDMLCKVNTDDDKQVKCVCGGEAKKTMGSYKAIAHRLPNGHHAAKGY